MADAPTLTWISLSPDGKLGDREALPRDPGSYLLVLALLRNQTRSIGRLGLFTLRRGVYAYCGSALGPGGIRGRLAHHLRAGDSRRWHIDSLLPFARLVALAFAPGDSSQECRWSRQLGRLPNASFPVAGFGSSDCRRKCPSHLILLPAELCRPLLPESGRPLACISHEVRTRGEAGRRFSHRSCRSACCADRTPIAPKRTGSIGEPERNACQTCRLEQERTCAEERHALKEAVLSNLETLPHGA